MLNLAFGWVWITMGFLSGAVLGMGFHREGFMGGYGSWPRRLARLGHIAFFGTGFLNVLLGLTVLALQIEPGSGMWGLAQWSLVVGAIAMPVCCFIAAWSKRAKPIFVVPVVGLTLAGVLVSIELVRGYLSTTGGA